MVGLSSIVWLRTRHLILGSEKKQQEYHVVHLHLVVYSIYPTLFPYPRQCIFFAMRASDNPGWTCSRPHNFARQRNNNQQSRISTRPLKSNALEFWVVSDKAPAHMSCSYWLCNVSRRWFFGVGFVRNTSVRIRCLERSTGVFSPCNTPHKW